MPNPWYDHRGRRHDRPDVEGTTLKIIGAFTMMLAALLIIESILAIFSS